MRGLLLSLPLLAMACTPVSQPAGEAVATRAVEGVAITPKAFPRGVARSNATLAEDFIDLTFSLESGQPLTRLLRYEEPVRVVMRSAALRPYTQDLDRLLARIRQEAGVDIKRVTNPAEAQIHISAISARQISRVYPGAACFIVPGETTWNSFRKRSRSQRVRWSEQSTLGTTAIFLPSDSTPQEVRDCLHEEIGQTLGPANDIYRLPDSVFNDDNYHGILTPFDMLMLRTLYHPGLRSGLSQDEVRKRLVPILRELNPKGQRIGRKSRAGSNAAWKTSIEDALTRNNSRDKRLAAANRAVDLASRMLPQDHRLGVALLTRGRLLIGKSAKRAGSDFEAAYSVLSELLGPRDVRTAQAALHLGVTRLRNGDATGALTLADQAIPVAKRGENGILTSGLYAVRAEALNDLGQPVRARLARVESLKWARLAFGDQDGKIARAQSELERLSKPPSSASRSAYP